MLGSSRNCRGIEIRREEVPTMTVLGDRWVSSRNAPLEWLCKALTLQMVRGVMCDSFLRSVRSNGGDVTIRPGLWKFEWEFSESGAPLVEVWCHETHHSFAKRLYKPVNLATLKYVPRYGRGEPHTGKKKPFPYNPRRREEILALGFDTWYAGLVPELDPKEEEV